MSGPVLGEYIAGPRGVRKIWTGSGWAPAWRLNWWLRRRGEVIKVDDLLDDTGTLARTLKEYEGI